jgi:uncharacterized protein YutE (UPF0331/DUF86 family)
MDRLAKAERLAALLQKVGFAVWQLAEVEDLVANYVVLRLQATQGMGEEAARPLFETAGKKTFGQLLKKLRDAGVLDQELVGDLERLVDERNWVVHRAKRENRGVLDNPSGYAALQRRLDALADDALQMQKRLAGDVESYVRTAGVPAEVIDAEAARLQRAWGLE